MAAPTTTPTFRYSRLPANVEAFIPASGVQTNPGDLLMLQSGVVVPVSSFAAWNSGAELQNWSGARSQFLGVSLGQHNSYDVTSGSIPVGLDGEYHYPWPAASGTTVAPGSPVCFTQYNPIQGGGSGYFFPQALMISSGTSTEIGVVTTQNTGTASGQGELSVRLQSTIIFGTIQTT